LRHAGSAWHFGRSRGGRFPLARSVDAFGRAYAFGENAVHQRVLNLIGIAENVAGVEANDIGEIVDALNEPVGHAGLDGVLDGVVEELAIENARKLRRPHFDAGIDGAAIH
jgi:hypothetical protein